MADMLEGFRTPPTFMLTTGGEEERRIVDDRDRFFCAVRAELRLEDSRFDPFFKVEHYQLNFDDSHPTDSRAHYLDFSGIQTVAEVLDKRDDGNLHVVSFAAHSLCVEAMSQVFRLWDSADHE